VATVTPNFDFPIPQSTDLVKDGATAIAALGTAIDTDFVDLKGGTTGQVLAKASNTDLDFSWVAQDDSNAIQNAIVDAKGDLIAATAADTPARLAVGNNGEILVPDSSTATGLRYQAIQTRNCVYNSSFEIWQRGTSFTAAGYAADRWYASTAGVAGRTISRVAGSGQFQYLTRIQRTAGNTATNGVDYGQPFEISDSTPYAGKTVTLSFYARKGADFAGTLNAYVFSGTSSTEANRVTTAYASGGATPLNQTVTLSTTLTRYQYTFTFGASVTQFCILFSLGFSGTAGAADYFDVTGVQIEVGSVATDYVRQTSSIQNELAACRRYFYLHATNTPNAPIGLATYGGSTYFYILLTLPVAMRTAPTIYVGTGTDAYTTLSGDSFNTLGIDQASANQVELFNNTQASGTTGQSTPARINTSSGYLGFQAEL